MTPSQAFGSRLRDDFIMEDLLHSRLRSNRPSIRRDWKGRRTAVRAAGWATSVTAARHLAAASAGVSKPGTASRIIKNERFRRFFGKYCRRRPWPTSAGRPSVSRRIPGGPPRCGEKIRMTPDCERCLERFDGGRESRAIFFRQIESPRRARTSGDRIGENPG